MSTRTAPPTMVSIYSGRDCLGFVLSRGRKGFEAFAADEQSLGVFPNQRDAANAATAARIPEQGMRADALSSASQTVKDSTHG
jgi:hypothetical protein